MTTDPRIDLETRQHWEGLTQALRVAVAELDVPEPVKVALNEVLSLHCAWEKREQVFGWGRQDDVVHGIGCRMCDYLPSAVVPLEHRHCQTVEALRQALLPGINDPGPDPWFAHEQKEAWYQGWTAAALWMSGGKTAPQPVNPYIRQP